MPCSTPSRRPIERLVEASADLLPVLVVGAPLRHRSRLYNCAVVIHRGELLGVAPKSYLPTYREFYERRWFAPGDDQARRGHPRRRPRGAVRPRPALRGAGRAGARRPRRGVRGHVGARPAVVRGGSRRRDGAAQPLRQPDHDRARRGPQASVPVRSHCAASPPTPTPRPGMGESTNDLSWDGQTMIYEGGALLAETERFPDGPRRSVADVDLDRLRQDRLRQGTFDDNRRTLRDPATASARVALRARPAGAGHRTAPRARPVPVRARRPGAPGPGLLRGVQHPGLGAGAAHGARSAARSPSSA